MKGRLPGMLTIQALRQCVQKVADADLKTELLGKISDVQRDIINAQVQMDAIRSQLGATAPQNPVRATVVYDPPV